MLVANDDILLICWIQFILGFNIYLILVHSNWKWRKIKTKRNIILQYFINTVTQTGKIYILNLIVYKTCLHWSTKLYLRNMNCYYNIIISSLSKLQRTLRPVSCFKKRKSSWMLLELNKTSSSTIIIKKSSRHKHLCYDNRRIYNNTTKLMCRLENDYLCFSAFLSVTFRGR